MNACAMLLASLTLVLAAASCAFGERPTTTATQHYSSNYWAARVKFLSAAREAGATVHQYQHPTAKGPDGKPLFTDVVLLGPADAENVLVVISGTHGVEGFCGSAVQTGLLRNGLAKQLPDGVRVVFIHALNPYGFAWLRRFNEDSVDENRNYVDHGKLHSNDEYDDISIYIVPEDCSDKGLEQALEELIKYGNLHSEKALQDAITRGQYKHPTGLHYGGKGPTWSNRLLHKIVKQHISPAKRVVLIDVHTGLGEHCAAVCIMNEKPCSDAYRRARKWWGDRVESTKDGSISSDPTGTLKYAFARMFPAGTEVTATSLEFGTLPPKQVFRAMQAENCLHHHGQPDDCRAKKAKLALLRAFYPDEHEWKNAVWKQSREVVAQALNGIADLKEHD